MKLYFQLFLLVFSFKTTEAFQCYACDINNDIHTTQDNDNCMFPDETTNITHDYDVCLSYMFYDANTDYYWITRKSQYQAELVCRNKTIDDRRELACHCKDGNCNNHTLKDFGYRCYHCGYSSDGMPFQIKDFNFTSDPSCASVSEKNPSIPCATRCIEGKRMWRKKVLQLYRACTSEWPTITDVPEFDEQRACSVFNCNNKISHINRNCFSCGFSTINQLSLGNINYKNDDKCMNMGDSSDKTSCMSTCIEVQNRNGDDVSIIRECMDKFADNKVDTSAWPNVHYCDGETCNNEYTYSDKDNFNCYYCVYHTQGKDVTVDNITFKHSDNCLYPKEGTNKAGHYTKCTEACQEFEVENGKSEFVVIRKGDGVFGSEWMTKRECKTSLCNMQFPGFPVPASPERENHSNKMQTSFVIFVLLKALL